VGVGQDRVQQDIEGNERTELQRKQELY